MANDRQEYETQLLEAVREFTGALNEPEHLKTIDVYVAEYNEEETQYKYISRLLTHFSAIKDKVSGETALLGGITSSITRLNNPNRDFARDFDLNNIRVAALRAGVRLEYLSGRLCKLITEHQEVMKSQKTSNQHEEDVINASHDTPPGSDNRNNTSNQPMLNDRLGSLKSSGADQGKKSKREDLFSGKVPIGIPPDHAAGFFNSTLKLDLDNDRIEGDSQHVTGTTQTDSGTMDTAKGARERELSKFYEHLIDLKTQEGKLRSRRGGLAHTSIVRAADSAWILHGALTSYGDAYVNGTLSREDFIKESKVYITASRAVLQIPRGTFSGKRMLYALVTSLDRLTDLVNGLKAGTTHSAFDFFKERLKTTTEGIVDEIQKDIETNMESKPPKL